MPKVDYADLESVTKLLDKIGKDSEHTLDFKFQNRGMEAKTLSKMIKDKYTEIKPHYYER